MDLLVDLINGPLGPLLARSYPGVNGRPILVRYLDPPHPLKQGRGLGGLGLEIRKEFVWRRRKVATKGPEGVVVRFA